MEKFTKLRVYERCEKGKVVCMCLRENKLCGSKACEKDEVLKDKFYRWPDTFIQDKYGKSADN